MQHKALKAFGNGHVQYSSLLAFFKKSCEGDLPQVNTRAINCRDSDTLTIYMNVHGTLLASQTQSNSSKCLQHAPITGLTLECKKRVCLRKEAGMGLEMCCSLSFFLSFDAHHSQG
jgi:hypothetical protein